MVTEVAPVIEEHERARRFPSEIVRRIGELGWLGIPIPEDEGGAGLDTLAYAIAIEEIGRVWGSLGLIVAAHTSLGLRAAPPGRLARAAAALPRADGAGRGHRRLRPDRAGRRERFGRDPDDRAAARTGRTAAPGSSTAASASSRTPARRARTSSPHGRAPATTARPRSARSSCPPTPPASASGGSRTSWACTPRRPASSAFDGARVPAANLLGEQGSGFKTFLRILDGGRISIGALAVGIAQGALDASIPYAQTREQFGRPIGTFQGVAFMVADMATEIEAARGLVWRAAWLKDQGRDFGLVAARGEALRLGGQLAGRRTTPSRSTAATATSRTTRSSATCATRS